MVYQFADTLLHHKKYNQFWPKQIDVFFICLKFCIKTKRCERFVTLLKTDSGTGAFKGILLTADSEN